MSMTVKTLSEPHSHCIKVNSLQLQPNYMNQLYPPTHQNQSHKNQLHNAKPKPSQAVNKEKNVQPLRLTALVFLKKMKHAYMVATHMYLVGYDLIANGLSMIVSGGL